MSEDRSKILTMLAEGKITPDEAERLLDALAGAARPAAAASGASPKYMRVQIDRERGDDREPKHVNIRVPLQLLRAGVRLQGLIPQSARATVSAVMAEKGVNLDLGKLKNDDVEVFIAALSETAIDIDAHDGKSRVKVSCE